MTDYLTPIEIGVPYEFYHDLLAIVGRHPSQMVAPIYLALCQAREDATTDDIMIRLDYQTVYRLIGMLGLAPACEGAELYLIFADAKDRHDRAFRETQEQKAQEIRDREAPLRAALDAAEAAAIGDLMRAASTHSSIGEGLDDAAEALDHPQLKDVLLNL